MKPATSNLASRCGLLRPIMNPTRRKSGCGPGLGKLPEIWGFPVIISATAEASDFKFGMRLGFGKAHDKITRRRKGTHGPGLGMLSKIWRFPLIFTRWLKLATSNLVYGLGLPRPIIKPHPKEKWA